jgi:hypothetical protein
MAFSDDHYRYIEYLQRQTLDEDWAPAFDATKWKSWITKNRARLQEMAQYTIGSDGPSLVAHLERHVDTFEATTRFDLPTTKAIFEPVLAEVKNAVAALGIKPIRSVEIITSTDSSASPAARPTTGEHLLLLGPGTSSFCNYWAKAITAVLLAIPPAVGFKPIECVKDLEQVFHRDPSGVILAARLSLYYAAFGTMLGFGEVQQPESHLPYRLNLLRSMETFAVAHEYAHLIAEERLTQFSGSLDSTDSQQLEFFCDELGLVISRECGNAANNQLSFSGIGALVFFRAVQLCESVQDLLVGSVLHRANAQSGLSSHPTPEERIVALKSQIYAKTAPDQRVDLEQFVEEYDRILSIVATMVVETVSSTMEQQ